MDFCTLSLKIARGENLPILPEVVCSVFKIADNPKATPKDIEELVSRDPALTAKLLRAANSSAYGVGSVPTIARALPVLGMNKVRSLLVSVAFQNMVAGKGTARRFRQIDFWRHSLAVAVSSRMIAQAVLPIYAERLYCIGMLHDIGLIAMDKFCPDILDTTIEFAERSMVTLDEAESRTLDFTHAALGGVLAEKWGFGPEVKAIVSLHHDPKCLESWPNPGAVISIADILAHETGFTNQLPNVTYKLEDEMVAMTGMTAEQLVPIREAMCEEVIKAEQAMMITKAA